MSEPFLWGSRISFSPAVDNPQVLALRNGTFLVIGKTEAATPNAKMKAWIYNADGSLKEEKILESASYGGFWENLVDDASSHFAVELPDGRIALTWSIASSSPGHSGSWMGLYGSDLKPLGKPIPVAGLYGDPQSHAGSYKADDAIALADGSVVATYRSLGGEAFLRILSPSGTLSGPISLGLTLTSDPFTNFESVIDLTALPGGKVVAAVRTSATENTIYILDSASLGGTADPSEISIPIVAPGGVNSLEVTALEGGGFVVTWTESGRIAPPPAESEPSVTVRFQVYNADGEPVGDEPFVFYENITEAIAVGTPDIVALPGGGFALAAQVVKGLAPNKSEVRLATFTAAGERVSDKLLVSQPAAAGEFSLQGLSVLADGRIAAHLSNGIQIVDPRSKAVSLTGTTRDDQYIGTSFNDTMDGGSGDDSLDGAAGNDHLDGASGNDILKGGDGHDTLYGGAGSDRLDGGNGIDFVSFVNAKAGVTASLLGGSGGDAAGDVYSGIEGLLGSSFDDVFIGSGSAILKGRGGNDIYYIKAGDVFEEAANEGRDTVIVGSSYALIADAPIEVLRLEGVSSKASANLTGSNIDNEITGHAGKNSLRGLSGNDVLKALSGNDTLKGDAGSDTLYGGSGNDRLYGGTGSGKDVFVFDAKPNKSTNVDRIYDFNPKYDAIWLENKVFTKLGKGSLSKPVKFKSDMFVKGKAAKDKEDRIVYDSKTGALSYDQDGTGSKAQVKIATLNKNLKLTHSDFFVI